MLTTKAEKSRENRVIVLSVPNTSSFRYLVPVCELRAIFVDVKYGDCCPSFGHFEPALRRFWAKKWLFFFAPKSLNFKGHLPTWPSLPLVVACYLF